jgi:hypothetical protein
MNTTFHYLILTGKQPDRNPPKKALKSHEGISLVGNEVGFGEVSIIPKDAEERTCLQFRVSADGKTSSE